MRDVKSTRFVVLWGLLGTLVAQAQPSSAPVPTAGYKYVVSQVRLEGVSDTGIERQGLYGKLRDNLNGALVEMGDKCDVSDCDLITVDEINEQQIFEVQFTVSAARTNRAHAPRLTHRYPLKDRRLIWKAGLAEIVQILKADHAAHTLSGAVQ